MEPSKCELCSVIAVIRCPVTSNKHVKFSFLFPNEPSSNKMNQICLSIEVEARIRRVEYLIFAISLIFFQRPVNAARYSIASFEHMLF